MSKFLLLAFRNVFRNRRRTLMTLLMVGGGVAGLLLAGGYFAFMTAGFADIATCRTRSPADLYHRPLQTR